MERSDRGELLDQLTGGVPADAALAAVLDTLPDAIVVVDADGRIRYVNSQIAELAGYEPAALVGESVDVLVPETKRAQHGQHRARFAGDTSGRPMGASLDIELRRRDGTNVPVDISLAPVIVGGARFVVAAVRDATTRRRSEHRVRQALRREREAVSELQDLSRLRDSYLRALSHDLRTPLAAVTGLAETASQHLDRLDEAALRDLLSRIRENGQRLERMLNDLLELDRATRRGEELAREDLDVSAFVREVVADLDGDAIDVTVADDGGTWPLAAAPMRRILENLILNARKHAPGDEPVTVRFEHPNDDVLVLVVEDRGPGVPDADKERIFDAFVRGRARESTPGSGIGLSLVSAFASAHGGRAWVEDRPGGGASFRVALPR